MSATRQEPSRQGSCQRRCRSAEESHYDGGNLLSPGRAPLRGLMDDRLLDALLERSRDEAGGLRLTGEGSMLGELVKAVLERALEAELTAHLGYEKRDPAGHDSGNSRNGTIRKPGADRDRAGGIGGAAGPGWHVRARFDPETVRAVSGGLDDMIISLYAHGSVRDILHHLRQVYGTELSPKTVSRITDQVLEEVKAWQSRPLDLPCLRGGVHFQRSRSRKITPWLCGTRRI